MSNPLTDLERRFDEARTTEARNAVAIEIMRATDGIRQRSERTRSEADPEAVRIRARAVAHFGI